MRCVNLEKSSQVRVKPWFLPPDLGLLPPNLRLLLQSEMSITQHYAYFADSPYGFRGDWYDCWMKGKHDEITYLVEHDLMYTQAVW